MQPLSVNRTEKHVLLEEDSVLHNDFDIKPGSASGLSTFLGVLCCPATLLLSWFTVAQNTEMVILNYGKYIGVIQEPGCHFSNFCGRKLIPVSKAKLSIELHRTKVIDANGSPLLVSGAVVYYYHDTRRTALDISNPSAFVRDQASAVLKQVVGLYPYENLNDNSEDSEEDQIGNPALKDDAQAVDFALITELQRRVVVAGAKIESFKINEISYAPEIAAGMLKKQQAQAIVASRQTLVDGAVKIAVSSISRLRKKQIVLDEAETTRLISNLLAVSVTDEQVHPMLQLGTS